MSQLTLRRFNSFSIEKNALMRPPVHSSNQRPASTVVGTALTKIAAHPPNRLSAALHSATADNKHITAASLSSVLEPILGYSPSKAECSGLCRAAGGSAGKCEALWVVGGMRW